MRFGLDFLRESDSIQANPRYGGLTPAQWACFGLLALGVYYVRRARLQDARQADVPPTVVAASDGDRHGEESAHGTEPDQAAVPQPGAADTSQGRS